MRTVSKTYQEFKETFGAPENRDDYGHFAAENYLANSNQLYAVRATMGDEQYSQIQYAFPNASTKGQNLSKDTAVFKFVDNEGDNDLHLAQSLDTVISTTNLIEGYDPEHPGNSEWLVEEGTPSSTSGFALKQEAEFSKITDIKTQRTESIVYKKGPNNISETGVHVVYPSLVDVEANVLKLDTDCMIRNDAWEANANIKYSDIVINTTKMQDLSNPAVSAHQGVKISFTIPSTDTLDSVNHRVSYIAEYSAVSGIENANDKTLTTTYKDLFNSDHFYIPEYLLWSYSENSFSS